MLKRKHSSSSLDNSDQGDDVSISSSVLSKEKEELKNLFCNYIDRLSRKFKVSKNPKCLAEFSNTLHDIKQLSKNDKKGSVKRPIHLRETDSSDEECSAPPKNNLKSFFEERISKICDVQEKPHDYESNPSDLSEFDKNKSASARMILKEKLSNKKRQDLVKKWKDKHFEKTSDSLSMSELQTEKVNLEILIDPKKNSGTSSTSSVASLTESRNVSKPVDDRNNSAERIVVQNSIESTNHVSDEKVLHVLSPQAANVEHQTHGGSYDFKTNDEEDGGDFGDILECDDKNEQSNQVSEDILLSMNDSEMKTTSDHDLIEKECEIATIIEVLKDDISKNKKIKTKKSKHKSEKTHHKAKSSKHKSLKSGEKKSKLKSLKANISRSPEVDARYQSYRRDSRSVSRSRNASISRTREENRRGTRQTRYSKYPRSSSYRRKDESDDHDDRREHRRSDKQRRNLKRVRNFLSLDSSVEEVFSNDEAYHRRERSSSRKSYSSKSDASSMKSIDNKKVHSRWSKSSEDSEISKNSNLKGKAGLKKPRNDSPDDDSSRKFEFNKRSCAEIKKKLRKTQEKDSSSLVENKGKMVNSNGPKKKLSKVAIDLQDLISTEIISNLQQEQKNKKKDQANNDGLSIVKKQTGSKKSGSKSKQNHARNNSNSKNVDLNPEKTPLTFETTQDLEVQSSTNFSQVVDKDQVDINQLGRAPLKISFKPRVVPKNINTLVEANIKLSSSKFDLLFGERDPESECSPSNGKVGLWREINSPEEGQSPLIIGNKKAVSGENKKLGGTSLSKGGAEGGKEKGMTLNGKMKPKANEQGSKKSSRDQYLKNHDEVESIRSCSSISRSVENHRRTGSRKRSRSYSRSSYSSMSRDKSWRGRRSRRRSYSYSSRSGRWSHRRSCSWSRSRSYSSRRSRRWRNSSREDPRRYLDRRSRSWSLKRQKSYSSRSSSRTGVRRLRSYRDWSSFSSGSRSRSRWPRSRSVSRRQSKRRREDSSRRHPSSASRTSESQSADSEAGSKDENAAKEGHLMYECGDVLHDRYEILSTLGTGTFSKVVDCVDLKSNCNVALKIVKNVQKYKEAAELEIGILKDIAVKDKHNENFCIQLHNTFDHLNHQCLVFDSLGLSLYEFLKSNFYQPYTMEQIKHIGYQLIRAVKFLHGIGLMHTDLKPENILFVTSDFSVTENQEKDREHKHYNMLKKTDIRIIDFGSAVYDKDVHEDVVSTRQYRAIEVILELGWNRPCDVWSIGCILFEMYTGHTLFQTHSNVEHLVMMEAILGPFPPMMIHQSRKGYFTGGRLRWDPDSKDGRYVKKNCKSLKKYMIKSQVDHQSLFDLMSQMLTYDPRLRATAARALEDRLFAKYHGKL